MKFKGLLLGAMLLVGATSMADQQVGSRGAIYANGGTFYKEQMLTEQNQARMLRAQPPVKSYDSLERKNINERTKRWNDSNKTAFLYTFVEGVGIVGRYAVQGKVSSVNSSVTNPEQILAIDLYNHSDTPVVVSAPAEDGSYGSNGDAVFFFTEDGTYREWNGIYELTEERNSTYDKALKVKKMQDAVLIKKLEKEFKELSK